MFSKTLVAVAATAAVMAFGVSTASAGGRSKDDRVNFYRTVHESVQPWKVMYGMSPAPTAPAGGTAKPAAKPAPRPAAGPKG
ncbi:hypothetical protein NVS89_04045 [Ancylobacter sp. MQZ15Z-1]|uniref:Uncharacterized protein n=1 Tax=Ancylobacter mangrovi TaxID=2972472 RepID=A0A9X2T2W5_9HYPH|nr:hypothetical protein [Ancylobacter mangrovi]MCS0494256.1 hypothetical protein [Ancylobacter mangrovi]